MKQLRDARALIGSVGFALLLGTVGCGGDESSSVVLRDADGIQVMTPEAVAAMKSTIPPENTAPVGASAAPVVMSSESGDAVGDDTSSGSDDTIPLNEDDRPPELKLFDAYSKFKGCIEDNGETIRGDLQDRSNPAYQDPNYMKIVSTCAAKSDIVNVLQEVQASQAEMSPDEIKTRNERFKELSDCLIKKGWTVETVTDANGLINPRVFRAADGTLNQRDLDDCLSETGIADALENGG
jgi:hypothetical protein